MIRAGTLPWFAQHECRLAWRDWLSMMTAGRRARERTVIIAFIVFIIGMHLLALSMIAPHSEAMPDRVTLVVITGSALLGWSLMLSQAMESVTRAFYTRSDLDLILSSPTQSRKLFAVRIGAMALSTGLMAVVLAAPFINVLALRGGARWLSGYGVVIAMGAAAGAIAVALTVALFRTIGPKRTRLVAQVVAAIIAAGFLIGLQVAAILSYGSLSRFAVLESDAFVALAPNVDSLLWWPARAILGDVTALAAVLAVGFAMLGGAIVIFSARFGEHAIAAASVSPGTARRGRRATGFRARSQMQALRHKEWVLLLRDPWLVSQSLMQILYLLPPALLLWRSFGEDTGALVVLVPVLVMAAGQLAGGLAWLAISGEDAPDLVATAPITASSITRAKVEAVLGGIAVVFAPFVVALAFLSAYQALIAVAGVMIAAGSATAIQLWFRTQAKRSHFRRRQTSSRVATFAEAFSSIAWAATAALAAAGTWLWVVPGLMAIGILAGARLIRPKA